MNLAMNIAGKSKCSGCSACANICPVDCIKMLPDEEGFLYPEIEIEKCINCGACKEICPSGKTKKHAPLASYAVKNKEDETRLASTSGGIFTAISKYVFENDGVVVGCKFNENLQAVHDFAANFEEAKAFRGAKYVQSILGDTFQKVKALLEKEKLVLFTGTPCQVVGLAAYLGKDYENLITCDLVCHSVPSEKALKAYIKELEDKHSSKVKEFYLREKALIGWQTSNLKAVFENGEVYREVLRDSAFMKGFNLGLYNRPSCANCSYKEFKGASDITIGDYWGIELKHEEFADPLGVSLVFINNEKGEILFEQMKENLEFIETPLEETYVKNPYIVASSAAHRNREKFFEKIASRKFSELVEELLNKGGN